MKSKFAMMAMLVLGLLMSGTGAGLAVSGLSSSESASQAQYPCEDNPATPRNECVPPVPTPTPPPVSGKQQVPCDLNGDGVADATEDLNGQAPGCADGDVLPTNDQGGNSCDENGDGIISPTEALKNGCGGVRGETNESNPAAAPNDEPDTREAGAQPTRQVEANDKELPFTGFAAVPILIGGIALMGGGLVLRRRTAGE